MAFERLVIFFFLKPISQYEGTDLMDRVVRLDELINSISIHHDIVGCAHDISHWFIWSKLDYLIIYKLSTYSLNIGECDVKLQTNM